MQEVGGDDEKDAVWTVPGWAGVVDPTTGQEYFYNSETGETSWEKPAELATKGLGAVPPPPPPPLLPSPPPPPPPPPPSPSLPPPPPSYDPFPPTTV